MKQVRLWMACGAVLALAGVVFMAQATTAQEDPGHKGVLKIAELVKKGDKDGAAKAATKYATRGDRDEILADVMHGFKPAKKGGIGVGATGTGIEQALIKIGRDAASATEVGKMADAYQEMGNQIIAIGLITEALAPKSDKGKQTRKDWIEMSKGMTEAGALMAAAGKAKSAADLKTAAAKTNNSCNSCHTLFR